MLFANMVYLIYYYYKEHVPYRTYVTSFQVRLECFFFLALKYIFSQFQFTKHVCVLFIVFTFSCANEFGCRKCNIPFEIICDRNRATQLRLLTAHCESFQFVLSTESMYIVHTIYKPKVNSESVLFEHLLLSKYIKYLYQNSILKIHYSKRTGNFPSRKCLPR